MLSKEQTKKIKDFVQNFPAMFLDACKNEYGRAKKKKYWFLFYLTLFAFIYYVMTTIQ